MGATLDDPSHKFPRSTTAIKFQNVSLMLTAAHKQSGSRVQVTSTRNSDMCLAAVQADTACPLYPPALTTMNSDQGKNLFTGYYLRRYFLAVTFWRSERWAAFPTQSTFHQRGGVKVSFNVCVVQARDDARLFFVWLRYLENIFWFSNFFCRNCLIFRKDAQAQPMLLNTRN